MDMANFCKHCGAKLNPDAKFCPNCGQPAAATATDRQRNSRKRSISLLNLFLAGVLLVESLLVCFWHPGILKQKEMPVLIDQEDSVVPELKEDDLAAVKMSAEPTGMSSIRFDPAAVQPETVTVSGENSSAHFDSGVSLNFGDFCLYDETHQVEVRSLGTQSDEEFDAVGFDLLLDGQPAEFDGLVQVTLPCDPAWGDDVFVQYWDEQTGDWEILYAESDGKGSVTFRTDHFCTFAEFKQKVENGKGDPSRPIFRERQGVNPTELWVDLYVAGLAARVREGKLSSQARIAGLAGGTDYVALGIDALGGANSGLEFAKDLKLLPECSEKILGPLGQAVTLSKFLYQGHNKGWSKAWKDNRADLAMLAVGSASTLPPPVGPTCMVISAGYTLYSSAESAVSFISDDGNGATDTEKAYRTFTKKYLLYERAKGGIAVQYTDNMAAIVPEPYYPLPCGDNDAQNAQWLVVFQDAIARESAGKGRADLYVERVIDGYVNAFWRWGAANRAKYAKDKGYSDYKEPDPKERDQYVKDFKEELCGWLMPYFENLLEKQYEANLKAIYSYYFNLHKSLNTRYTLQAQYEDKKYLTDTPFSGHPMGLSESERAYPAIELDPIYGNVSFTGAYWVKMGAPTLFRVVGSRKSVYDEESSMMLRELRLKPGLNTITLETSEPAAEPITAEDITPFLGEWKVMFLKGVSDYHYILTKSSFRRFILDYDENEIIDDSTYEIFSYDVKDNTLNLIYLDTVGNGERGELHLRIIDEDHLESLDSKNVWTRVTND